MKALIYDIKRFAIHDGPGIRITIFFKGCPLGCWWCHNPESRKAEIEHTKRVNKIDGKSFEVDVETGEYKRIEKIIGEILKEKVFMDESGGGVTLSGGEPLLQHEFVINFLDKLKALGIHTAIDTTGYASKKVFSLVADKADLFLYDLKNMNEEKHLKYTGVSNKIIFQNLEYLHLNKIPTIIRYPFIPGITDKGNIEEMKNYLLKSCPDFKEIHILPYHNIAAHKYRQFGIQDKMEKHAEPGEEEIDRVKNIFENAGFHVKIGG